MYNIEREDSILEILRKSKSISVEKLADILYVSSATVRRDLSAMARKGLIKRTFGGAVIADSPNEELSIAVREQSMTKSKRRIATKAVELIKDNQSVFFDSSSTVCYMVDELSRFHSLAVATNGLNIAMLLSQKTDFKVLLTSGVVQSRSNSALGVFVDEAISRLFCDIFFFSCGGIDLSHGITESNFDQSGVKRAMMAHSSLKVLLVDSSKFGKFFFSRTCDVLEVDVIVTDAQPSPEYVNYFSNHGIKLIY